MQREDVSEGVSQLADAIIASGIIPLLARLRKVVWDDRPAPATLLACYAAFAAGAAGFGRAERTIMRELDILRVNDVAWWARMVLAVADPEPPETTFAEIATLCTKLRFVADTLPNLLPNLAAETPHPGTGTVRIVLLAKDNQPFHPLRLTCAIEAVCILWSAVCELENHREPLAIIACEPGPDMAVTFRGPDQLVTSLKQLLMHVWERIVVSHNASLEERIAAIPRTLPVMERISDTNPAAVALRRQIERGVRMFLEAGACMPEMDDPARFTPARLLHVKANLLAEAFAEPPPAARGCEFDVAHVDAIVAEEREHLVRAAPGKPAWAGKVRAG